MPKSRVPSTKRKARGTLDLKSKPPIARFLGLSLSGGKSDKSVLAVLDHYPDQGRIFLSGLHEKIKSEEFISADRKIVEMIEQLKDGAKSITFDAPLSLPICLNCPCDKQPYETCPEPQIKWLRQHSQEAQAKKRPRKMFTPYTQRPIDLYLSELEDENLEVQHALGANLAPLTARAIFLMQRMTLPCFEAAPKMAVWRLGHELKLAKTHLRSYRNSVGGSEARDAFLHALSAQAGLFVYQQDQKALVENPHAFDALICAWMGFLKEQGKTEKIPSEFPKGAAWVEIPLKGTF